MSANEQIPAKYVEWRIGRDTGISSETIWGVMLGLAPPRWGPDRDGNCNPPNLPECANCRAMRAVLARDNT